MKISLIPIASVVEVGFAPVYQVAFLENPKDSSVSFPKWKIPGALEHLPQARCLRADHDVIKSFAGQTKSKQVLSLVKIAGNLVFYLWIDLEVRRKQRFRKVYLMLLTSIGVLARLGGAIRIMLIKQLRTPKRGRVLDL